MSDTKPPLDPHPLSPYVAWAGNRNKDPILQVFKDKLPKNEAHVLEFATGSGMHINFLAPEFSHLSFHPSDKDDETFDNIKKLTAENGNSNIVDPVAIDLTDSASWPDASKQQFSAIFCINIFQVAPVSIADGMMKCAASILENDGKLYIYGPFKVDGGFTTDSNKEFNDIIESAGVAEWGLKDVNDISHAAEQAGMKLVERVDMPTNNFMLVYGKG